ncbi:hypothetical protein [Candidatus Uabimicrobium amorphum]|uniref:Uncharacterized protein n=1 Tax=Uabimicrobium amorphum TaxID=2596890 RepID=A0A5S9IIR1_UABAM|nr:hypothetical protein [Candidatus Uabimicrobium amorphum]BBM82317.1 hypothetical protein UABAM_00660 [Candidatus Uabimicrobium amorphum]
MRNEEWNNNPMDATVILHFAMKTLGIVMVIIGVVFLFSVTKQIWELFENPAAVKNFSQRFEEESGIDKFINSMINASFSKFDEIKDAMPQNQQNPNNKPQNKPVDVQPLHISYFAAWFFKIILLSVIARIALWMIREGSTLARKERETRALIAGIAREMCTNIFNEMNMRNQNSNRHQSDNVS